MTDFLEALLELFRDGGEEKQDKTPPVFRNFSIFSPAPRRISGENGTAAEIWRDPVPAGDPENAAGRQLLPPAADAASWGMLEAPESSDALERRAGPGAETLSQETGAGDFAHASLPYGGAAALERRLRTAVSLPTASPSAAARVIQIPAGEREAADWDDLDRRLERDARRYDGGLSPY